MTKCIYTLLFCFAVSLNAVADLTALNDHSLRHATGEGLGLALEGFILDTSTSELAVTGIESSNGDPINIKWTDLYIMGEGSQEGTVEVGANIGSYLNPYIIQTVRGSLGLDPSDAAYNSKYDQIGSDLALLEFATDSYESDLQNSATFGLFSFYQGCVWGEVGCNNLADVGSNGVAVQAISSEINALNAERLAIDNRYSIEIDAIETQISTYYQNTIIPQEVILDNEQAEYDAQATIVATEYDEMKTAYDLFLSISPTAECPLGTDCSNAQANCPIFGGASCRSARDAYNDQQGQWEDQADIAKDEYNDVITAKQRLGELQSDPDAFGLAGVSYIEAIEDVDRFKTLCGYADSFASCADGLIARKETNKSGIESVSVALFGGSARRNGMDIGASFEFDVNAVAANGSTSIRKDFVDIDMKGVFVDGTSLRLWSASSPGGNELNAELRLNLFIKELDVSVCDPSVCGGDEVLKAASTLNLDNIFVNLNLGYGETQPLKFSATADGNFVLELTKLNPEPKGVNPNDSDEMLGLYQDYYANSPKSFISIGDVRIGSAADASLGGITIDGFRAQYLKVTSRDL